MFGTGLGADAAHLSAFRVNNGVGLLVAPHQHPMGRLKDRRYVAILTHLVGRHDLPQKRENTALASAEYSRLLVHRIRSSSRSGCRSHRGLGLNRVARQTARMLPQRVQHALQNTLARPRARVVLYGRKGRVARRNQAPPLTRVQYVLDRIEDSDRFVDYCAIVYGPLGRPHPRRGTLHLGR